MMTDNIQRAAALLRANQLVAFPTETVYGIGGNALSDDAVAAIYAVKQRPEFNPLIVHVRTLADAEQYAQFNDAARTLAKHFWPGPLTLVVRRKENCALSLLVSAGLDCVALRSPAHKLAQALLRESALPIAAPSANRSGRISPTEATHVREELGDRIPMVLDGGPCPIGIESTVIDMTGDIPIILRPGSVTEADIRCQISDVSTVACHLTSDIRSPGQLVSHYAPSLPLRLNATEVGKDEALLAFGNPLSGAYAMENLSMNGDLQEAAANLFRMLRRLDASGAKRIAAMPIPEEGLGIAINDRLKRAAAPRGN